MFFFRPSAAWATEIESTEIESLFPSLQTFEVLLLGTATLQQDDAREDAVACHGWRPSGGKRINLKSIEMMGESPHEVSSSYQPWIRMGSCWISMWELQNKSFPIEVSAAGIPLWMGWCKMISKWYANGLFLALPHSWNESQTKALKKDKQHYSRHKHAKTIFKSQTVGLFKSDRLFAPKLISFAPVTDHEIWKTTSRKPNY